MASVSEILNVASKMSGLRAESAELDIALMAMNQAYFRACTECELTGKDATYTVISHGNQTATTFDNILAEDIAGEKVFKVQHLSIESAGNVLPVQQVSRQEIQDYRATQLAEGIPILYSVSLVDSEVTVSFYPKITVGDKIKMSYLARPLQLATATSTTSTTALTYLPETFHHDIVTNAVISALLERDGQLDKAQLWSARSLDGIVRLEEYLGQMGGNANRAYVNVHSSRPFYPDYRQR